MSDVEKAASDELIRRMMFYPLIGCDPDRSGFVSEGSQISLSLARRLSDAYNIAADRFGGYGTSFWAENDARNADLITALRHGDLETISMIANDPGQHSLFWGVDGLTKGYAAEQDTPRSTLYPHVLLLHDSLLRLAEAVGIEPVWYPEAHLDRSGEVDVERILDAIDEKIGVTVDFPNPFPVEFGLKTSRGIASYRTFQSIYQAWRLLSLSKIVGKRIVEIGPGLGRTAYYARKFGLTNYSTVDLPLGIVAQASFLSRALGEEAIALPGEPSRADQVIIETPSWFFHSTDHFDMTLNADSLTEMDVDQANKYVSKIMENCRVFVSVNHEINAFKVADLTALSNIPAQRFPYWMRKGYVEDLYLIFP